MQIYFNLNSKLRQVFFVMLMAFAVPLILCSQTNWKVNTSSITFKIKNAGITVDGSCTGLVATIKFDATDFAKGSIEASVDANTVNTGIDMRNNHLKKDEYFDVAKYPKISLKSVSIAKDATGTYKGVFKLTMKNVTKDIVIPFTYTESGNTAVVKGSFKIDRRDYTVGGNSWTMSDDVNITLVINAVKQ